MLKNQQSTFQLVLCFLVGCLFLIITNQVVSFGLQSNTSGNNHDVGSTLTDSGAAISSSDVNVKVFMVSKYSTGYTLGKRAKITGTGALFHSDVYGGFQVQGDEIGIYQSGVKNINCESDEVLSYYFSGSLLSTSGWFELDIVNDDDNYYCPASQKFSFHIDSSMLGYWKISNTSLNSDVVTVSDSRGYIGTVSFSEIFNDKLISVDGRVHSKNLSRDVIDSDIVFLTGSISLGNTRDTDIFSNNVTGVMSDFNRKINKNIEILTRGVTPESTINMLNLPTKPVIYYDYEGQEDISASNENNKGKIVILGAGGIRSSYDAEMIDGKKTLIVKGGNIYIKTDIVNKNENSVLVIVTKRDTSNYTNGGNIYIDPNVTNIDAVLVADGSIMSYNGTQVLTSDMGGGSLNVLRNQLLIYGAISSKNTLGEDITVYGTDAYIDGNERVYDTKYNMGRMRSFQPIINSDIENCNLDPGNKIVAMQQEGSTDSYQYAFAGKKQCYLSGTAKDLGSGVSLRSTDQLTPVVIEYNPLLRADPPFIISN